ncbi:helix-turn-helix domain-containing protein [Planktotalea arctica]|uniref:helix-turn-helix domain-containing protein n=1 Tax=Planktotalea arctica TaxID=1481893 RepID=UPI000A172E5F|nr:helix-turn-helix transcriptional regulator [Planktotalea arctica]
MQDSALLVLPLPILTALLGAGIAVLLLKLDWGSRKARLCFALLFALLSLSSMLVGLRFGYGIEHLILVQRILPLLVGPLIFLGFAAFAIPKERFRIHALRHLGAALLIMGILLAAPRPLNALDWVISGSYLFYIVLLLQLWRKGPDHLIHAHFDVTQKVSSWMLRGVFLMTSILVIDTVIAFDFALNSGRNAKALISFASIPILGALLALIFILPSMIAAPRGKTTIPMQGETDDRIKLEQEARAFLMSSRLYLEPDLSVQRLARRLHVAVRDLSVAVNQTQGVNVSQYVNRFRMDHAADLLRGTDESVAKVMAQSGFLTRSNFYREFKRIYGQSPAAYRQGASGGSDPARSEPS